MWSLVPSGKMSFSFEIFVWVLWVGFGLVFWFGLGFFFSPVCDKDLQGEAKLSPPKVQ